MDPLYAPLAIRGLEIKNRLSKSATFETRATPNGFLTDDYVEWYRGFARGGVGLIHTGITYPDANGRAAPYQAGLDDDDKIPGFRRLAKAVHEYGARLLVQLHHPGRQLVPNPSVQLEVVAPSAVKHLVTRYTPRALSVTEIKELVQRWAIAARRAEEAGADGIQLHAAHGYLLNSFLSARTNRRDDEYGGSLEGRTQILRELVTEIRKRTQRSFLITIKLNGYDDPFPNSLRPSNLGPLAERIGQLDVDAFEISSGSYEYPRTVRGKAAFALMVTKGSGRYLPRHMRVLTRAASPLLGLMFRAREGFNMDGVRAVRPHVRQPILCLGGFHSPDTMRALLESRQGDMISLGRQLIADPDWPNKVERGETPLPCSFCNHCISWVGEKPATCFEQHSAATIHPPGADARAVA